MAKADGTEARRITSFGAGSFAPFFTPDGRRILFSSNLADPKGREFDIWSIRLDGSGLERVTTAPGFDGFPIFSPDGKVARLQLQSRAVAPGRDQRLRGALGRGSVDGGRTGGRGDAGIAAAMISAAVRVPVKVPAAPG